MYALGIRQGTCICFMDSIISSLVWIALYEYPSVLTTVLSGGDILHEILLSYYWMFSSEMFTRKNNCLLGRDKVLCDLWAWDTANGKSPESHLWIIHGLCLEESLLWDGDAYKMWAFWHQPNTGDTKRSRRLVGQMICFLKFNWPDC